MMRKKKRSLFGINDKPDKSSTREDFDYPVQQLFNLPLVLVNTTEGHRSPTKCRKSPIHSRTSPFSPRSSQKDFDRFSDGFTSPVEFQSSSYDWEGFTVRIVRFY